LRPGSPCCESNAATALASSPRCRELAYRCGFCQTHEIAPFPQSSSARSLPSVVAGGSFTAQPQAPAVPNRVSVSAEQFTAKARRTPRFSIIDVAETRAVIRATGDTQLPGDRGHTTTRGGARPSTVGDTARRVLDHYRWFRWPVRQMASWRFNWSPECGRRPSLCVPLRDPVAVDDHTVGYLFCYP